MKEKPEENRKNVFSNSIIQLDVGGKVYKTTLQTLTKDPASMLAAMFSGRFSLESTDNNGSYFIDRDGQSFRYILNYLRNGTLTCPDDVNTRQALLQEAQFYQIRGLIDILESPSLLAIVGQSVIITQKEYELVISNWLPHNSTRTSCQLLYRASDDGWLSRDFHRQCDHRGCSLVLMKTKDGFIGGGYTAKSWEPTRVEKTKPDKDSFVFTITNPSNHKPTKFNSKKDLHNQQGGIVCSELTGPYFGTKNYFDFRALTSELSRHVGNHVDLGHGYECPSGLHSKTFMFGSGTFELSELEVFEVKTS